MKPAKQSKDFSVCLNGLVLPSGVIYGNVSGQTYYFRPDERSLTIFDRYKNKWRSANPAKYSEIMKFVRRYERSSEFDKSIRVRFCQFKQEQRDKDFRTAVKVMRKRERDNERFVQELLPYERKANYNYTRYEGSCYSQRAIEGKMYLPNDAYENYAVMDKDTGEYVPVGKQENPFPVFDMLHDSESEKDNKKSMPKAVIAYRHSNFNKPFEKGQNTSGPLAFVPKKDGMKIDPMKRTVEEVSEKNAYLVHHPAGVKFKAPHYTERYKSIANKMRAERDAEYISANAPSEHAKQAMKGKTFNAVELAK